MKRVFCSILAGLMMLSMFTGCSSSQNSSAAADGEKTVVELWTVWKTDAETGSGKVLREAAEEFMAQNPDIVINISNQGAMTTLPKSWRLPLLPRILRPWLRWRRPMCSGSRRWQRICPSICRQR